MSLRTKTLLIYTLTYLLLLLVVWLGANSFLLHRFTTIERELTEQRVSRSQVALQMLSTELDATLGDWAPWDETYAFIHDRNREYITANLDDATLRNLRLNVIIFVNNQQQVVFAKTVAMEQAEQVLFTPQFIRHILAFPRLTRHAAATSRLSGILDLPECPLLVASQPILHNDSSGPIRGTLIMGRTIDANEIALMQQLANHPISILRAGTVQTDPDAEQARRELSPAHRVTIHLLSEQQIAGYLLLTDIHNAPAYMVRLTAERRIYQQAKFSVRLFVGLLLASGLVLGLVQLLHVERAVLSRVFRLNRELQQIGEQGNPAARIIEQHSWPCLRDELDSLVANLNATLASLEASEQALRRQEALRESEGVLRASQERLRALTFELAWAEERERRRIATDLHDHIGQTLATARLLLGGIEQAIADRGEQAAQVREVRELLQQGIAWTRSLTLDLNPPVLTELGLAAGVQWLADMLQQRHGLNVVIHDLTSAAPLRREMQTMLYQMTRELLFNVVKHARASQAEVTLRRQHHTLIIEVSDNGLGFDAARAQVSEVDGTGFGLFSIRERLQYLGGDLLIEPGVEGGSRVTLRVPYHEDRISESAPEME